MACVCAREVTLGRPAHELARVANSRPDRVFRVDPIFRAIARTISSHDSSEIHNRRIAIFRTTRSVGRSGTARPTSPDPSIWGGGFGRGPPGRRRRHSSFIIKFVARSRARQWGSKIIMVPASTCSVPRRGDVRVRVEKVTRRRSRCTSASWNRARRRETRRRETRVGTLLVLFEPWLVMVVHYNNYA